MFAGKNPQQLTSNIQQPYSGVCNGLSACASRILPQPENQPFNRYVSCAFTHFVIGVWCIGLSLQHTGAVYCKNTKKTFMATLLAAKKWDKESIITVICHFLTKYSYIYTIENILL
jgi:hypothetical protein